MKNFKQSIVIDIFVLLLIFSTNSNALNYIEDAKQYIEKGEYNSAIIQLKNSLKAEPKDDMARLLLGKSYLKIGNIKLADKEISRAYQLNSTSEEVVLAYAQMLLLKKNYTKIHEILDKKYSDMKKEQQRQIVYAYAFLGLNQLADAKEIFSQLKHQEANVQVYNGLARIALLEKEYEKAELYLDASLKIESENTNALQTRAQIAFVKGNYADALAIYNHLIEQQPNNLNLYLQRAYIKAILQDLNSAEKDILKVLKTIKNQTQANYMLARIKLLEKNYKEAQTAAQNVLNIKPRDLNSMLILGITHFALENYNQADKYLTQYLSINPDSLKVQNILANVYLVQKKAEQALLILEGIDAKKRDQNAKILMTMGSAYIVVGEYKKGIYFLQKARDLKPDNIEILKQLTAGQFKIGEIDHAISGMEIMVNSDKTNEKITYLLILTYMQRNELEKADTMLAEFIQKRPNDPELYNLRGALEGIKGNGQESRLAYEQAIALDKNFIAAYIGLAKDALSKNDFEQAKEYFKRIITIDKSYNRAYIALATIAEKENKTKKAEEYLRASYDNSKNKNQGIAAATLLGKWYGSKQQLEKLLLLANNLLQKYPKEKQALSFLVGAQLLNNNLPAAKSTLHKIINRYRNDTKHRLLLVNLLNKETGHEQEILILLDEVIQIKKDSPEPLKLKAAYLLESKHYDKSLSIAKKTSKLFPNHSIGYQLEGNVYMTQNQVDKALSSYKKGYQVQPENKLIFLITGILENQGKQSEAISFLQSELNKNNKNIGIHFKLANIYQKNDKIDLAIKHYKVILEIKSNNVSAMNNLAWIYFQQGNQDALSLSEKAFKNAPDSPSISDTYGYILLKTGNVNQGVNILEKSVKRAPQNNKIKYHLAEGYYLKGDYQKSKHLLEGIISSSDNEIDKQNATSLLAKVTLKL